MDAALPPADRVNILLVDDRPENLVALRAILSDPQYNLVTATSGDEALRAILRGDFALILLDVLMPGMDGFEIAALIKQREPSSHIPIIFLTAAGTDIHFIYKGYSVGAVDYLVKPIDPDVVKAKVAVFVDLYRKEQLLTRQSTLLRESEQRERALQVERLKLESELHYQSLADAIPQIVVTTAPDGGATGYNRRWFEYTGMLAEASMGWGWAKAVHPDDRPAFLARWREAIEGATAYEMACRMRRAADGAWRWQLCRALPERDASGAIIGWIGTCTDIDDQKRAAAVLDKFKATLDAVLDGVWMFGPDDLCFTYVNEGAAAHLGYSRDELLAMGPLDLLTENDETAFRELLRPLVDGSRDMLTVETVQRARDGTVRPVEVALQCVHRDGVPARCVAIVRDVTERRRAEEDRARLYHEAQIAVKARDEFLSTASHELKTPLTALQLQVKGLLRSAGRGGNGGQNGSVPLEKLTPRLQVIERQVDRLSRLVNNLLDVSRITAGRIDLDLEEVDLSSILRDSAERARDEITRAGCSLVLQVKGPVVGRWDSMRLEQVVTNLLSNAVKYGSGKPIEVALEATDGTARLTIRDHGIGIAVEDQTRIFQRFERAVSSRHIGGLGLGLWIVRQIVNALRGEIGVVSEPGSGSTFVVELPRVGTSDAPS